VLASSEKIGAASPFTVLPLSGVSGIITDAASDHPVLRRLRRAGTGHHRRVVNVRRATHTLTRDLVR
jgi:DeoR/GlpR family transcriptional regulator of sugar metabolism